MVDMGIWNDIFESFLDAEYGQDLSDDANALDNYLSPPPVADITPRVVYVFMQFDESGPTQAIKDPAQIKAKLADNEKRLQLIERQYEALVAHFGQEAVEAAKQALRQRKELSEESDDDTESSAG